MRKNKWIAGIVSLSVLLSACSATQNQTESVASQDYEPVLPYDDSDSRIKHAGVISDTKTQVQIESGLADLSKDHFSPVDYKYKSQEFLDYDELDATDGSRGLLGTLRDKNPNGLNPASDEEFDTGNGKVTNATVLADIYELDFYKNKSLKGISLALVVNSEVGDNNTKIKKQKMYDYVEVTANKLVNYMHDRFNEVTSDIPIYVAAYEINSDSSSDSLGGYIYSGYFDGNSSKYKKINDEWIRVPSTTLQSMDETTYDRFTTFHDDVYDVLDDTSYVIGEAEYVDGSLSKMNITVTTHGRTAGEIQGVISTAKESMSVFKDTKCEYTVSIVNDDTTYCILKREKSSKNVSSVSIL
ncbi:CamS family sex pheromone protein [Catenisphaera adipataccumulans]|jgi:protein involved in sex pheromone biosynthesis|uniref:Protein involved in sex pheromone biosynthesis n=1 Tax=Catenisphaera adipataccumulans TaxID=700500 RepID=A0A7W8CXJ8_9FIRM|nr:CamS family sex pheromone protein [Catenisphaera adipataccumulans]MBB5182254.1 protein involved in sex pheromone biosynthesis [Catenisphaera adipataccumulans]